MKRKGIWCLFFCMLIAVPRQYVSCQATFVQPSATLPGKATPALQMPAYDAATIKPPEPNGYATPLRVYIQSAYGIPVNCIGWVIGPDWINNTRYVIQGKPAESMQKAMETMTDQQRWQQEDLMMQSLLADRFALKAHFETREMPVYQLIVAKGGPKLKEDPDSIHGISAVNPSFIRGKALSIRSFIDALESVPDIGGRVVVDKTELSGSYDFLLKWTPLQAVAPSHDLGGIARSPTAETVSLFTAIEEQLGLKLIPTRGPGQVLVIDHIERPSPN